jgi:hypothetical protein
VATWDDVRDCALGLPETAEGESTGQRAGRSVTVRGNAFVWERALRPADVAALTALGQVVPEGNILAARVTDEGAKQALVADSPDVFFTTPHFNGYPAVLIQLDRIDSTELREVVTDAWIARAPKRLVAAFLSDNGATG